MRSRPRSRLRNGCASVFAGLANKSHFFIMPKYLAASVTNNQRVITSASELHTINDGGVTKYRLEPGRYLFSKSNFLLIHPFYLDDSAGGTIEIYNSSFVCLFSAGDGALFDQDIGNLMIVRLTSCTIVGNADPNPATYTRTCFNLGYSAVGSRPVILIDYVQPLYFTSVGTIADFDTAVFSNFSIRACATGITFDNMLNLISLGPCNLQDAVNPAMKHLSFTGTTNLSPSIQGTLLNYIPNFSTEKCILIDSVLTPNVSIGNSVYDSSNTSLAEFYDSSGLTETSIYVVSQNVKNVPDSSVRLELYWTGAETRAVNVTNQWHFFPEATPTVEHSEKCTNLAQQIAQVTSLEPVNAELYFSASVSSAGGTNTFEYAWFQAGPKLATVSDAGADTFTHSDIFQIGDIVTFNATTFPAPIVLDYCYRVNTRTTTTFTVENATGTGTINLTTASTDLTVRKMTLLSQSFQVSLTSTTVTITKKNTHDVFTGDEFVMLFRNASATSDLNVSTFQLILRN